MVVPPRCGLSDPDFEPRTAEDVARMQRLLRRSNVGSVAARCTRERHGARTARHLLGPGPMADTFSRVNESTPRPLDAANRRWPLQWIGAAAGVAAGLGDVVLMLVVGVEMQVGGVDATGGVLAFLAVTYAVLGYVIGRLLQERARARRDALTIERQLRALERAQRELVQQEKLAALGRVAAGVAHEVRNPLGVIRASAAMVQESFAPQDDAHRACQFICEEIDRLNALITALLSFSRPTELRRHTVSLETVVEHALRLAGDDLRKRRIAVACEAAPDVPPLSADPDLVSQLIYDLVSNASEAVGFDGSIAVRTARSPAGVSVEVADSGAGVDPEFADQLFEPFFTTKPTGTGLGLPMAERIAHAHGGKLAFVPGRGLGQAGRGACFRLELPLPSPSHASVTAPA
jgi:two-component system sensor histidine kinase HydH